MQRRSRSGVQPQAMSVQDKVEVATHRQEGKAEVVVVVGGLWDWYHKASKPMEEAGVKEEEPAG